MTDYEFPWFTSIGWIFGLFAASLVVLHVVLIRVLKFDKLNWKQVDYVWVSLAMIGIFANVEQLRSTTARNHANIATSRAEASFGLVRESVRFGTSGGVCRTFVRSEFSPPEPEMAKIQREFDAQCEWFKKLSLAFDQLSPKAVEPIDISKLQSPPPPGGEPMAYRHLNESIAEFNRQVIELNELRERTRASWLYEFLQVIGPSLLAIAVALRLTKVTGEILLERK